MLDQHLQQIKKATVFIGTHEVERWQHEERDAVRSRVYEARVPGDSCLRRVSETPKIALFLNNWTMVDVRKVSSPLERLIWGIME